MPSMKQESLDFSKYIQRFCQLPKYPNENYLPVVFSRRDGDELFAALVIPYGLTNDYVSKLYYYENSKNKWAVVCRETEVTEPKKSEKELVPDFHFKQNISAFQNGKKVFSRDYHGNVSGAIFNHLFNELTKNNEDVGLDLSQMITGGSKIEEFVCKKWNIRNTKDLMRMKFHKER